MDVTEAEFQLIIACRELQVRKRERPNRDSIAASIVELFEEALDLAPAFDSLRQRGLLSRDADQLTPEGLDLARKLRAASDQAEFGEWMVRPAESAAYAEFCRRVYETQLVHFNMADAEQIEALVAFLRLTTGDRVLDLGCSVGSLSEHLADRTGARVTGLDFSSAAIALATERTRAKRDRLQFVEGDMNDLQLEPGSFTAVISVDTLYYAEPLEKVVANLVRLVAEGGRLALFYSQKKTETDPPEILDASGTRLGVVLSKLGLDFQVRDFSASEHEIWRRTIASGTDLKPAFESEGTLEQWQARDSEARHLLQFYDAGAMRRYLYTVEL